MIYSRPKLIKPTPYRSFAGCTGANFENSSNKLITTYFSSKNKLLELIAHGTYYSRYFRSKCS